MVIGENARREDIDVNAIKEKQQTNVRAAAADQLVRLVPAKRLSLEQALEFLREDECVEVTPEAVRLRKVDLDQTAGVKVARRERAGRGRLTPAPSAALGGERCTVRGVPPPPPPRPLPLVASMPRDRYGSCRSPPPLRGPPLAGVCASGVLGSGGLPSNSRSRPRSAAILRISSALVGRDEARGDARGAGAAGAAGAVHVGVAVLGGVEVDHVGDVGDVDAAGGDVGRDERVAVAALEAGEGAAALVLVLVAVHRQARDLVAAELLHQPVGAALGADEDQGAAALGVAELADQGVHLALVASGGRSGARSRRASRPSGLWTWRAGVLGVGLGELAGRALERRREEQRLALLRHLRDDPVDGGLEAHVEHPVGLVEDEDAGRS